MGMAWLRRQFKGLSWSSSHPRHVPGKRDDLGILLRARFLTERGQVLRRVVALGSREQTRPYFASISRAFQITRCSQFTRAAAEEPTLTNANPVARAERPLTDFTLRFRVFFRTARFLLVAVSEDKQASNRRVFAISKIVSYLWRDVSITSA